MKHTPPSTRRYAHCRKTTDFRPLGRSDGATHPSVAEKSSDHYRQTGPDAPVFLYPARGACGRRGSKRGNWRGVVSGVARSAEWLGRAVRAGSFPPSAPRLRFARTLHRGWYAGDLHGSNRSRNVQPILCVVVRDEEFGRGLIGKGVAQLLCDPSARRMASDVEVQDAATVVADNEEAIENIEFEYRREWSAPACRRCPFRTLRLSVLRYLVSPPVWTYGLGHTAHRA